MKKIRFLILFILFAMAMLGGSYAAWSDHVSLTDVVETGTFNLAWQPVGSTEADTGSKDPTYYKDFADPQAGVYEAVLDALPGGSSTVPKNIAKVTVQVGDDSDVNPNAYLKGADPRQSNDYMELTLENGYPGYKAAVYSKILNTGTVPAKFMIGTDLGKMPSWLHVSVTKAADGTVLFDSDSGASYSWYDKEIEPGGSMPVNIAMEVRKKTSDVPEDATAQVVFELLGRQWNGSEGSFTLPDEVVTVQRK